MTERSPVGDDPDPVIRLAAQHAELLDDARPGARAAVEADDPDAARVFAALDRTRADLADLGAGTRAVPPPPGLADDIRHAVSAQNVAAPTRPTRRGGRHRVVLLAAAAALLAVVGVATVAGIGGGGDVTTPGTTPDVAPPVAQGPAPPPERPAVRRDDLPSALRTGLAGGPPTGAGDGLLADPTRLTACLGAHGVPATTPPIAARPVLLDGAPGVLLVLPTGTAARFRVLVVGEACGAETPLTLADADVGR